MAHKVIFHSRNKSHRIGADRIQHEIRYPDGKIERSSHVISFANNLFVTTNLKEANIVRDTPDFQMGTIREITEEEMNKLVAKHAQSLSLPVDLVPVGETQLEKDVGYREQEPETKQPTPTD